MLSFYPVPSLNLMLTGKIFFHKLGVVHEVVQNWTGSLAAGRGTGPLTGFPWSAGFNLQAKTLKTHM